METKFNFKSSVCTDKNQSERLLALGLKKETADMYITNMSRKGLNYTDDWQIGSIPYCNVMSFWDSKGLQLEKTSWSIVPAWSLHRLIEMMPMSLIEDRVYHERWDLNITPIMVLYRNQDRPDEWIGDCLGQGMYNNVIDCIEWLIEEGYFNKEYLV